MRVTRRQLRRIIKEERARLAEIRAGSQEAQVGELEADDMGDHIAASISTIFQDYVHDQDFEGTGPTWNSEVQDATQALYEAIASSTALVGILDIINMIDEQLHNGEFHRGF